jgi:hypothetical protein
MSGLTEKYLPAAARGLHGAIFLLFGLNGFFTFLPMPEMEGEAADFMGALVATGYMIPLIKTVEVVAGAALLLGRYVPLALTLLAPDIVNIVLFHLFLAPIGLPLAFLILALELYLAWSYRDVFRPVLSSFSRPTAGKAPSERFQYEIPHADVR